MIDVFEASPRTTKAVGLMASLRYQVFAPVKAVFAPCPKCDQLSRGGLQCERCLDAELAELLQVEAPTDYLRACRVQLAAYRFALSAVDQLDAQEIALKRQPSCREESCS